MCKQRGTRVYCSATDEALGCKYGEPFGMFLFITNSRYITLFELFLHHDIQSICDILQWTKTLARSFLNQTVAPLVAYCAFRLDAVTMEDGVLKEVVVVVSIKIISCPKSTNLLLVYMLVLTIVQIMLLRNSRKTIRRWRICPNGNHKDVRRCWCRICTILAYRPNTTLPRKWHN